MENAECKTADPSLFFPEKGEVRKQLKAQEICMNCPVFFHCQDWVDRRKPGFGIWAARPIKRGEE